MRILRATRVIAMVGASAKPERPSYRVMGFLRGRGFHVIPVNPGLEGQLIHEQPVVARLADIKQPIDMVNVFRDSAQVPALVDEVLALPVLPKFLWMQLGVSNPEAAAKAERQGLTVIMNRCLAIEISRLGFDQHDI